METTHLSSKGQIVIPQAVRQAHNWLPGLEFEVIDMDGSILLTPVKPYKPVSVKEVLGCVKYKGPRKSLQEMEDGIAKGAKKHDKS